MQWLRSHSDGTMGSAVFNGNGDEWGSSMVLCKAKFSKQHHPYALKKKHAKDGFRGGNVCYSWFKKKKKKDQNIHKHVGTQHWNSRWGSVLRIAQEWYSTFLPLQAQSLSCFCQEQGLGDWKPGSQKPLENRPASLLPGTSELTQGDVGLWEMLEDFRLEKTHGVTCLDRETVNRHSPLSYRFNAVSTAWHPALLMSRRLTAAMVK